jgi:hypothetical protein
VFTLSRRSQRLQTISSWETGCDCCEGESSSSKQHDQHRRPGRRFVYRPAKSPQLAVLPSRLLDEHNAVFFVVSARSTLI